MRATRAILHVDVLTIAITITVSVMPSLAPHIVPERWLLIASTGWKYRNPTITRLSCNPRFPPPSPRVNCNRGYARAADPCGSFQIRDTPLTRDVDRVMDFHVAVTGMKIACMARLELFFYMVMRTAPLDNCCSLFKSSSRALFLW